MRKGENIFLLVAMLFGVILFVGSYNIPLFVDEPLTPSIYAMIISSLLFFCSGLKLVLNIKNSKTETANKEGKITIKHPKIILYQSVMIILYVFGFTKLGFFISTFLYLSISLCVFSCTKNIKGITKFACGALGFTAFLFFLFNAFNIFLPNTMFF